MHLLGNQFWKRGTVTLTRRSKTKSRRKRDAFFASHDKITHFKCARKALSLLVMFKTG